MNNLIFHYQPIHTESGIYLHEAFSTRAGELYMVNPLPVEVSGDTEAEMESTIRAMETDNAKYPAISVHSIIKEMERWIDDVEYEPMELQYEDVDDEELEDDYTDTSGEVIDICSFIERNR